MPVRICAGREDHFAELHSGYYREDLSEPLSVIRSRLIVSAYPCFSQDVYAALSTITGTVASTLGMRLHVSSRDGVASKTRWDSCFLRCLQCVGREM